MGAMQGQAELLKMSQNAAKGPENDVMTAKMICPMQKAVPSRLQKLNTCTLPASFSARRATRSGTVSGSASGSNPDDAEMHGFTVEGGDP